MKKMKNNLSEVMEKKVIHTYMEYLGSLGDFESD